MDCNEEANCVDSSISFLLSARSPPVSATGGSVFILREEGCNQEAS